jgi:exosortase A-associated hydrolase 1
MNDTTFTEEAVLLGAPESPRVSVLHRPARLNSTTGLLVVVGGPQYRVGSHRQFVLLGRALASQGIAVLRFDLTGMGDSVGQVAGFEHCGKDVRDATSFLLESVAGLKRVCLWGLCDGASASLILGRHDRRVGRMILLNPWVRTEAGLAQAYLDSYYTRRLRSWAFWSRILKSPRAMVRSIFGYLQNRRAARDGTSGRSTPASVPTFIGRMLEGAREFHGDILVLLSGNDTVAAEFDGLLQRSPPWLAAFARPGVQIRRLADANHTFSRREWRDWVSSQTAEFVLRED